MATTTDDFRRDRRTTTADRRVNNFTQAAAPIAATPTVIAASTDGMRVSWGGIWGGVLTAVGLMLLLAALGVAIGFSTTSPGATDARQIGDSFGAAAGYFAAASLLVALFVGGLVSTRIGAIHDRATGFWEGMLVWVVSVLLLAYLAASGVSGLLGGAFSMLGNASQAMGTMMQQDPGAPSRTAWITFGGFVLSLAATILGAMAGRRRRPVVEVARRF